MMKKIFTKALASILGSSLFIGSLAGCSGGGSNSSGNSDNSSGGNDAVEKFEPITFASNGESISDYTIVISASANKATSYGATILQTRIKQAIGAELSIVTDATEERELEIILGDTNRQEDEGIDFNALGEESFQVKNVGNDLLIAGNDRGLLYGVYAYLEAIGYRFYTTTTERIPYKEEVIVPSKINLKWKY